MTLSPTFDPATLEYTCSTENASNKVTAVATDAGDTIEIKNGDTVVENAHNATWAEGANTLTVTVKDRDDASSTTVYTVTVTKTTPEPEEE